MKRYRFKAVDRDKNIITDVITANTKVEAAKSVSSLGYILLSIEEEESKFSLFRKFKVRKRISQKDVCSFFQQLATLLASGVSMDSALEICSKSSENEFFRMVISDINNEVKKGASLSDALLKYPKVFSKLYINMIRSGEAAGILPQVLDRASEHLRKQIEFKSKITSSIIYPSFLVATGIVAVAILILFVVPKFMNIFESMGVSPPFPIPLLAKLGYFVSSFWYLSLILLTVLFILFRRWSSTRDGKRRIYRLLMNMPVIGGVLFNIENAKFSVNLGTLLINGVPILKAVSIVKEMYNSPFYREELDRVYRLLREGKKLSECLVQSSWLWHPMVVGMCNVGEEAGNLGEMLVKSGEALEKDVEEKLMKLVSLIEPITILGMGLLVGSIVVSMITAIFSINDVVM